MTLRGRADRLHHIVELAGGGDASQCTGIECAQQLGRLVKIGQYHQTLQRVLRMPMLQRFQGGRLQGIEADEQDRIANGSGAVMLFASGRDRRYQLDGGLPQQVRLDALRQKVVRK